MEVYLIGGKARNGKDTLGSFMKEELEAKGKKVAVMQISNYIKHFAKDYFGWDGREETKPRTLLQELGTDIIRVKMNKPLFFIKRLLEDMEVLDNFFDTILVTDVRFPIEFEKVKEKYPKAITIHITRPELVSELTSKEQHHATETALDNYKGCDYYVINTDLDKLKSDAKKIVDGEKLK
jgi:hypothetical protein